MTISGGGCADDERSFRKELAEALDLVEREALGRQHRCRMSQGFKVRELHQPSVFLDLAELIGVREKKKPKIC